MCLFRVIETLTKVWETQKSCANTRLRLVFPEHFLVLSSFYSCLINWIMTSRFHCEETLINEAEGRITNTL